jgi:hypothetical protein
MVKLLLDFFNKEFSFEWIKKQQRAVKDVKEFFSFALALKFLNFTKPFKIHIDVSDFLIESICIQDGHLICF